MPSNVSLFEQRFNEYARTFAGPDGSYVFPVRRKIEHTFDVCRISGILAGRSAFAEKDVFLFHLCALFHDVSRFEQYQKFGTFLDAASFDHGNRSAELVTEHGFLRELDEKDRRIILTAIRFHNKPRIPDDCPEEALAAARMVRDADKLSILTIIWEFFTDPEKSDPAIKLSLPDTPGFTPEVLDAVMHGKPVLYSSFRCVNDFIITLFSWTEDLNYPAAASFALENRLYEKLGTLLPAGPEADRIRKITKNRLEKAAEACLS